MCLASTSQWRFLRSLALGPVDWLSVQWRFLCNKNCAVLSLARRLSSAIATKRRSELGSSGGFFRTDLSWTSSASEILLGGVLDHLRDGGVATFRIGACAAQIRRIHGEILASNFHRGSSKLPISAMTFLAVVERGLSCSLAVGAKSSSARGGAVAAHFLVPNLQSRIQTA